MKLLFAQEYEFSDWVYGTTIAINSKKTKKKEEAERCATVSKKKKTNKQTQSIIKQWRWNKYDPMMQIVRFNTTGA